MAGLTVSVVPDGKLAYGMQLPVQSLSVRVSQPWEQTGTVADMTKVAQAADDAGFLYVAVCHHVAIPPEPAEMMSTQWYDTVATLGYLAGQTTRTRLMSNVFIAAYEHPLVAAKQFATLDVLSNGRIIFGIGAGHVEGEFDALGVKGDPGKIVDFANSRLGAIGVSHLQVRLLARDAQEQCDQIAAFGAEVGPHLTRKMLS